MLTHITTERCQYTPLGNGVHKFIFADPSPAAVDEWIEHLEDLYAHSLPGETMCFLVDSCEVATQPLAYVTQRAREINMRYPQRPGTRTAFLYKTNFLASLARTFIIMLSRVGLDKVQFFPGSNREDDALAWLLSNQ